jgi:L-amino acid N-acyltransferase YncA
MSQDRPTTNQREVVVEQMRAIHWRSVRRIYAGGLAAGDASFETEPPATYEQFVDAHLRDHMLIAGDETGVLGWAVLSAVSDRCAYRGVAEDSVYVAAAARGRGVGRALLSQLAWRAEGAGIWTLQAGIFPENRASIALHHACGFRTVGRRERLGRREGVWRDVLLLERRSAVIV